MSASCLWSKGSPAAAIDAVATGHYIAAMAAGDSQRRPGLTVGLMLLAAVLAGCGRSIPAPVEYKSGSTTTTAPAPAAKPALASPGSGAAQGRAAATPILNGSYVVQHGDTLYQVAQRSGVALRDIITANGLTPPYHLQRGTELRIPAVRYHDVSAGETMHAIAREHQVSLSALVRENRVAPPYTIRVGQRLRLPAPTAGAKPVPAPPPGQVADRSTNAAPRPATKPRATSTARRQAANIPKPPQRSGSRFAWPAEGRVIARFGRQKSGLHNDGINIALPAGAPIKAAESGVVVYAGNEVRGFGNLILLRHDGGWVSAYGHNETILVDVGDVVRRGQKMATAGQSGGVDRTQLHFELRRGRQAVDPIRYLARVS